MGDEVIVIASSFGRESHPGWYRNVTADPDKITLTAAGGSHPYVAREVTGDERDRLYAMANDVHPGYAGYAVRAGRAERKIPVLALRPT